mmetsp:Transcript_6708/g.15463  ORF Transcript_6708/g.15463 Transcript_6708/m.15463 type:complete len:456 (-) Transcript_6708:623-1990(-)|eukprot:CAMPEP_0114550394 /NCGR_PEP_ID=MMETSP0114-20121206/6052_1 /TAXON_ID=31324 /ORGANISM="Goniomonas sp, Strain m" /LENGTH=455 /DNA_ID=CAMNT_0001735169 /DNA_START=55 /DNA_END=1422 /DNA_ORIENTATION=-
MGCAASLSGKKQKDLGPAVKYFQSDIERVAAASKSSNVRNQKKAAQEILKMASTDDRTRNTLVEAGILDGLINMLHAPSVSVRVLGAQSISKLSGSEKARVQIVEAGVIAPLQSLLGPQFPPEINMIAVEAFYRIAAYREARHRIVNEGVVEYLLPYLYMQDDLQIEYKTLSLIARLSQHSKSHLRMCQAVGAGKSGSLLLVLLRVLASHLKDQRVKRCAGTALAELCAHKENHKAILDAPGSLKAIIQLLTYYDDEVKTLAVMCVARLAENGSVLDKGKEPPRRMLVKEKCLPNLILLFNCKSQAILLQACLTINLLSLDPRNQVDILKAKCLPHLVRLSRCGNRQMEQHSSSAIARLATNTVNRPIMLSSGGFKPLIYNAKYGSTQQMRLEALAVLASLFHTDAYRRKELVRRACDKFKDALKRKRQQDGKTFNKISTTTYDSDDDDGYHSDT